MLIYEDMPEDWAQELVNLSKEDIELINVLEDRPIVFDEDCPETTPEDAELFYRVHHKQIRPDM